MRLIVVSIFFVGTIVFADENSFQTIIQSSLSEWIRNIELSDDGSYLAYSEDNAIIVWDLNQKKIIRRFFGHDFNIRNIKISHKGLDNLVVTLDRLSNRIAFTLIITAIIVGSSLIIRIDKGPKLFDYPALGIVGYILAGVLGLWLVIAILRSGKL